MKILGIVLIVLGLAGLIFQGVTYTSRDKIVDVGSLHVTAETQKTMPIPAIAGGLALAAGVALVVAGSRKG
jgi:membrane-bound ClpP family serine protease